MLPRPSGPSCGPSSRTYGGPPFVQGLLTVAQRHQAFEHLAFVLRTLNRLRDATGKIIHLSDAAVHGALTFLALGSGDGVGVPELRHLFECMLTPDNAAAAEPLFAMLSGPDADRAVVRGMAGLFTMAHRADLHPPPDSES